MINDSDAYCKTIKDLESYYLKDRKLIILQSRPGQTTAHGPDTAF